MARYRKLRELQNGNYGFSVAEHHNHRVVYVMLDRRPVKEIRNRKKYRITKDLVLRYLNIHKWKNY